MARLCLETVERELSARISDLLMVLDVRELIGDAHARRSFIPAAIVESFRFQSCRTHQALQSPFETGD